MKRLNIFVDETGEFGFGPDAQSYMEFHLLSMNKILI